MQRPKKLLRNNGVWKRWTGRLWYEFYSTRGNIQKVATLFYSLNFIENSVNCENKVVYKSHYEEKNEILERGSASKANQSRCYNSAVTDYTQQYDEEIIYNFPRKNS